jgi:hypothetical protein
MTHSKRRAIIIVAVSVVIIHLLLVHTSSPPLRNLLPPPRKLTQFLHLPALFLTAARTQEVLAVLPDREELEFAAFFLKNESPDAAGEPEMHMCAWKVVGRHEAAHG